jgi:uncharacterized protein YbjQ (UPF0145 family)
MGDVLGFLLAVLAPFALPLFFYGVLIGAGILIERDHLGRLARREQALGPFPVYVTEELPAGYQVTAPFLVTGSTVMGGGFLKQIQSRLRSVIGGEMRSYTRLLARGRREAQLRMMEEAKRQGAQAVFNVRFETSDVGGASGRAAISEIFCYGTAIR